MAAGAATLQQPVAALAPPGPAVRADTTLADSVAAGSVLIRLLPGTLAGEPVSEYRAIRIPTRGWLYQRSFFWRVPSDARERFTFLFAATRASAVDTVRLDVTVTAAAW